MSQENETPVLGESRVAMETLRVSDLRTRLQGRTDPVAQRLLKSVQKLTPKTKVTVHRSHLVPPGASPAAAPGSHSHPVASLGRIEPAPIEEEETDEQVTLGNFDPDADID